MRKALVQLLIVGLMGIFGVAYAEDCTSSEGRKRMICDLKGFKKGPPKIMDDACELWVRLTYEIDPALADFQRGLFEEEAGMDLSELLRLRHEAGDQFGAYAIGILQMSREARRYKTCDSGKAQFSWVETYEVAERVNPLHVLNPNTHLFFFLCATRRFFCLRYFWSASFGVIYPRHSM